MNRCILVFGMPRSGTTWIGKLFDSHPDTLYRHEPDSVQRLSLPLFPDLHTAPQYRRELEQFVTSLPYLRSPKVVGKQPLFPKSYQSLMALRAYHASATVAKVASRVRRNFPCLYRPTAEGSKRVRVVWKSIESPGRLGVCMEVLQDARAIHLMRHPCGYVASQLRGHAMHRFGSLPPGYDELWLLKLLLATSIGVTHAAVIGDLTQLANEERMTWEWVLIQEKILADVEHSGRVLTVCYEDVCAKPVAMTRQMFEFAGLDWQAQTEKFIRVSTQATDADYYSVFKNPLASAQRWRSELAPEVIERILKIVRGSRLARFYPDHSQAPEGAAGARDMSSLRAVPTGENVDVAVTGSRLAQAWSGGSRDVDGNRKLRLLVFTSLYPNAAQPRHGVFVEERLRHLLGTGKVTATVVAPVPWFPFRHARFGNYATFAKVPQREERYGIPVLHPRYPLIPKLGMNIAPSLMYYALLPVVRRLATAGADFDLIDAHYFYPDGVAAVRLGGDLGKPVVITARGTDVTLIPHYHRPRREIRWAAEHAAAIITVSRALGDGLVALGIDRRKMTVLRNGVDLDRFSPLDRASIRNELGLTGPVWLTVGRLIELKGVDVVIRALACSGGNATLLIAGDGPEERRLRRLVRELHLDGRVRFLGAIAHDDLARYYNAADITLLASSREGMPNVVLESLACGTPVVATAAGGTPEVLTRPDVGRVVRNRDERSLAAAIQALVGEYPDRMAVRRHAEAFSWQATTEGQLQLFASLLPPGCI